MQRRYKYPRTLHLPQSQGVSSDDKMVADIPFKDGERVIITEKMDGENTTFYSDGYTHARSTTSSYHESRDVIKALVARISSYIWKGERLCGENVYAKHSIGYDNLEAYFLLFSVWTEDYCTCWDSVVEMANDLNIPTVPVIYDGPYYNGLIEETVKGIDTIKQEGFVIRRAKGWRLSDTKDNIFKWVKEGHVQTDKHWSKRPVVKNGLRK